MRLWRRNRRGFAYTCRLEPWLDELTGRSIYDDRALDDDWKPGRASAAGGMVVDRLIEVLERSGLAKFAEQMDAADAATDQVRIEALDPRAVPDAAADDFLAKWCELTTPNADDGPLLARIREILRTGDVDRPSPDLRLVKGTDEA